MILRRQIMMVQMVLRRSGVLSAGLALALAATPSHAQTDEYAAVIQGKCLETLTAKMQDMSVGAVQRTCRCVADTVLNELSAADIAGTSGRSEKMRSSVQNAYLTCYLKAGR